jgi:hypothetical protein
MLGMLRYIERHQPRCPRRRHPLSRLSAVQLLLLYLRWPLTQLPSHGSSAQHSAGTLQSPCSDPIHARTHQPQDLPRTFVWGYDNPKCSLNWSMDAMRYCVQRP